MMRFSIIFLCIIVYVTVADTIRVQEKLSAYDILEQYDFPVGLLPKGATDYKLNPNNGKFTAYLNQTCSFYIHSYELRYKSIIKGVISKDKLAKLNGVSVKVELVWLKIVEVTRISDELEFSVLGIASADFGVDNFFESPQCGCGFHCNNLQKIGL
ncbi:hypothetical protein Lalb_Chr15g0078481 [Lupinus albus]|uniref:DUF538 domain-containing protein n=1 Tax=Lupinus albus TaxID=3870 RepID=A0A6A4P8B3_LUPAL|nr:hypothetical protein Lalb_Chr15g0078481 [Lupinus albus]